ncbi:MAG: VCBS repeat domain-containing M23 family metallopeptidase, partial [Polyangiaceae bacterium]|nr:VCBS repeat domain-containing M23 family metallopeptidase [Polyangiaceae bacterium]
MRRALSLVTLGSALVTSPSDAQVRFRRPVDAAVNVSYGFDHDSGSGCQDYACGSNCYDSHRGTDFPVDWDTPVLAGASGVVTEVFTGCPDQGYDCSPCGGKLGNYVRLQHADGSATAYGHMRAGGMTVIEGQSVACGQQIGLSGSSGCSDGPHVHFAYDPGGGWSWVDPYAGSCSGTAVSAWTDQGPYGGTPGASCTCSGASETCNGVDDDCDSLVDEDDVCEVALLAEQPVAYAPPSHTDVNKDGRADLCARGAAGFTCWVAVPGGWDASPWAPVALSDANGWADAANYATLRMGDVDGDGRADVCGRSDTAFSCALSTGSGFGAFTVWRDGLSDANGWANPSYYTTLRLADVDGDGREDLCARDAAGFGCWLSTGAGFDRRVEGPRWSDLAGYGAARHFGTLRMGDLDGDGRADVCVRGPAGIECARSDGDGFPVSITGPKWSDASGFGALGYWSTLRMADLDGDGREDLCVRTSTDLRCALSTGSGFGDPVVLGALSDANGWGNRAYYATLRVGDIDADGREELCAREAAEMACWSWDGSAGVRRAGPAWSDANGWATAPYYQTIRAADFDGDGRDDLCARADSGWRCHRALGATFGDAVPLDALTTAVGWAQPQYYSTIMSAGRGLGAAGSAGSAGGKAGNSGSAGSTGVGGKAG